jgi:hypothetical protein
MPTVRTRENPLHFFLCTLPLSAVLPAGFEIYDAHYWRLDGVASEPRIFDADTLVTEALRGKAGSV